MPPNPTTCALPSHTTPVLLLMRLHCTGDHCTQGCGDWQPEDRASWHQGNAERADRGGHRSFGLWCCGVWCVCVTLVRVRDAGAVARGWLYPQVLTTRLEEETKRADDVTSKLEELTTKVSACVRTTRGTLARALSHLKACGAIRPRNRLLI